METKHTKWSVDGYDLTSVIQEENNGYGWKHVCRCDYGYSEPEKHIELNKENAKLIAAAPDLLNACIKLMEWDKKYPSRHNYNSEDARQLEYELTLIVNYQLEAIKKATL